MRRWVRAGIVVMAACVAWAPAYAEDEGTKVTPAGAEEDEGDYHPDAYRVRLELSLALVTGVPNTIKKGPTGFAKTFGPNKDAGLPTHASIAAAAYVDIKVFEWSSIGGYYWGWETEGSYRHVQDAEGVRLNSTLFAPGEQVKTRVTIQHAEISLRYVWFHTETIHLWFGIGGAWASYGITLQSPTKRETTRVESYFGPALTYSIAAKLPGMPVSFFLTSGFAFSYSLFPSVTTHSRTGFRFHIAEGFEVTLAVNVHNARLTDLKGVTREEVTTGYKHKRAGWSVISVETGLALSF